MTEPAPQAVEPSQPPPPSAAAEVRRLHETALQRQRAGDLQGAIECYNQCIERAPTLADAYNNLAVLLKTAKRVPAAIACLRRAVGYAPQQSALHSNLGNLLWMALEFDDAMTAFQRALALDANRPETYHNLGLLHFSLGNFQAAIECYDRSLAIKREAGLVRWDRALALLASGDYTRGFAAFDERFDLTDPTMGFDRKLQTVRKIRCRCGTARHSPAGRSMSIPSRASATRCSSSASCPSLPRAARASSSIVRTSCCASSPGFPALPSCAATAIRCRRRISTCR